MGTLVLELKYPGGREGGSVGGFDSAVRLGGTVKAGIPPPSGLRSHRHVGCPGGPSLTCPQLMLTFKRSTDPFQDLKEKRQLAFHGGVGECNVGGLLKSTPCVGEKVHSQNWEC